jgi:hypothetical protein
MEDFQLENIHFLETKKNIIMDGNFTKITYSDDCLSLNSIYFLFPIDILKIEKAINKNIIYFNPIMHTNKQLIKEIAKIERSILEYYRFTHMYSKESNHFFRPNYMKSPDNKDVFVSPLYKKHSEVNLQSYNNNEKKSITPFDTVSSYSFMNSYSIQHKSMDTNTKTITNKLESQLKNGSIKLYKKKYTDSNHSTSLHMMNTQRSKENQHIVLKISGVWENNQQIGITYKFMEIQMITQSNIPSILENESMYSPLIQ